MQHSFAPLQFVRTCSQTRSAMPMGNLPECPNNAESIPKPFKKHCQSHAKKCQGTVKTISDNKTRTIAKQWQRNGKTIAKQNYRKAKHLHGQCQSNTKTKEATPKQCRATPKQCERNTNAKSNAKPAPTQCQSNAKAVPKHRQKSANNARAVPKQRRNIFAKAPPKQCASQCHSHVLHALQNATATMPKQCQSNNNKAMPKQCQINGKPTSDARKMQRQYHGNVKNSERCPNSARAMRSRAATNQLQSDVKTTKTMQAQQIIPNQHRNNAKQMPK